jgi:hypothetical protein
VGRWDPFSYSTLFNLRCITTFGINYWFGPILAVLCVQLAKRDSLMKKLALPMAAILALLSIAGCAQYVGKGKAPPPVVTKG